MNFEIFCLHVTGYSNTKGSFPICMFVVMSSGKCELHTYYTFLQRILTSTHMKKFNFFCIIYVAMPNIHFSGLDNVKIIAKHVRTNVSFKITLRKKNDFIDIRWTWIWNQYFYLGIWNNDRPKIIVLPSFELATWLNSQNRNEMSLLMNTDTLICVWIFVFPFSIIEVLTRRKRIFYIYFSSLHDYWAPSTWFSLVHTSWGEMERCEKRFFQLLKMRKNKISWKIKIKCVTDFWQIGLRVWRIIHVITGWAHKIWTFTLISIKLCENWNFCLHVSWYLNTKKSFP